MCCFLRGSFVRGARASVCVAGFAEGAEDESEKGIAADDAGEQAENLEPGWDLGHVAGTGLGASAQNLAEASGVTGEW